MIQRTQTLYLVGAIVLYVLLMCFPIGYFHMGRVDVIAFSTLGTVLGGHFHYTVPILSIVIISLISEVVTVFSYKNRTMQMRLIIFVSILQLGFYIAFIAYFFIFKGVFRVAYSLNWPIFIPLFTIVLNILAYKGIRKDENLVRSLNHLR